MVEFRIILVLIENSGNETKLRIDIITKKLKYLQILLKEVID